MIRVRRGWGATKGMPKTSSEMTNQPSTPPDRAKMVHDSRHNEFGTTPNNDDDWRATKNDANRVATKMRASESAEKETKQPPMPMPPPEPPPPLHRRPWPGTKGKVNSSAPVNGHGDDTDEATVVLIRDVGDPTRYLRHRTRRTPQITTRDAPECG